MPVSHRLRSFLDRRGISYEEIPHTRVTSAADAAEAAHVKRSEVAKAVLVRADRDYLLAVVPASQRIAFNRLRSWLGRDVRLADEAETTPIFADCEFGAIPAVGAAYELETIVDNGLMEADDVYFEAGDHRTLVHLRAEDWRKLMRNAPRGAFCIN